MRERSQNGRNQNGQRSQNGQQASNGQDSKQGSQGAQGSRGSQSAQGSQGSQGSEGSQGSQGAEGSNAQGGRNGGRAAGGWTNGSPNGPYGGGDARNWGGYYGGWNPDDVRQWRREYREWANDAEGLRRQLQASGVNPRDLDDIIRDLQKFDNDRLYVDPRGLELLQAAAIDKLKKFEFGLRRKADTNNESLSLSGSDQVPDGFRQAIEEYYRSLAKKQQR